MAVRSYRDLIAWQKSMDLVEAIYRCTASFPREELYGLSAQLRRAAISIPSNIAEGQGRNSTNEFINFLSYPYGSLCEIETQVMIARRLSFIEIGAAESLLELAAEVGRINNGLSASLRPSLPLTTDH
jgi:four helix bundle protein